MGKNFGATIVIIATPTPDINLPMIANRKLEETATIKDPNTIKATDMPPSIRILYRSTKIPTGIDNSNIGSPTAVIKRPPSP